MTEREMVNVTFDGKPCRLPAELEWSAASIWCPWGDMYQRDLYVNDQRVGKWGETPYDQIVKLTDGDVLLSVPEGY